VKNLDINYLKNSMVIIVKKKIFFIINRLGGFGWGGAHRVTVILANNFARKGYDVSLIAWNSSQIDYPIDNKVKIYAFNYDYNKEKDRMKACIETRKILKNNKNSIVYVLTSRTAIDIRIFTLFTKIKIIASERTDPTSEPKTKFKRFIRNQMFKFMDVSVFQTRDALAYFPKKVRKKGVVIPNPLSPTLIEPYNGKREKVFVTFCRIDKQKNLYLMIDSFIKVHKKYSDFTLQIFGSGLLENSIKTYISDNRADKYIIMNGFTKNIHEKIKKFYAYINSSDYEGMSNSMLEAMAIGMPVICTDCPIGGAKMIINNGVNGILVPTGNEKELTNAMYKLIENKDLCKNLSKEAVKIREKLSEENICNQWEKLIYREDVIK